MMVRSSIRVLKGSKGYKALVVATAKSLRARREQQSSFDRKMARMRAWFARPAFVFATGKYETDRLGPFVPPPQMPAPRTRSEGGHAA